MTAEIKKILFPVDLSDASPKLVPWVKMLAERFEAEVHVIFVSRPLDHYSAMYVPSSELADLDAKIMAGAEQRLAEFVEESFGHNAVKAWVISGYPPEEIVRYAKSANIDLIVMGTHGRKGIERIIFGSVAAYVVKKACVPVLTINPYRDQNGRPVS